MTTLSPEIMVPIQADLAGNVQIMNEVQGRGDLVNYFNNSMESLGLAIALEEKAKRLAVLAPLGRMFVLFGGDPSGGKSTISRAAPRLIAGTEDRHIANIPGQHDVNASQLVGGNIVNHRSIEHEAEGQDPVKTKETHINEIQAKLSEITRAIVLDEVDGLNPYALRSLSSVLASREIENLSHKVLLDELRVIFANKNDQESDENSFSLPKRFGSRVDGGTEMGPQLSWTDEQIIEYGKAVNAVHDKLFDAEGNSLRPEDVIVPTATVQGLMQGEKLVLQTAIPKEAEDHMLRVGTRLYRAVNDFGLREGTTRINSSIKKWAKLLAICTSEAGVVSGQEIRDASEIVLEGKLLSLKNLSEIRDLNLSKTVDELNS